MALSSYTISAPGRLHFGLFSVGSIELNAPYPQYGGLGLMIDWPRQALVAKPARELQVSGADQMVIERTIENWLGFNSPILFREHSIKVKHIRQLPVSLTQSQALPRHIGLGSGTQLAFATVTLMNHFFQLPSLGPIETARQTGRGRRSAIGSYGFFQGGFLVDRGKGCSSEVAQLDFQTSFPSTWPILIAIPKRDRGIAGPAEDEAFSNISPTPLVRRESQVKLAQEIILPGLLANDYAQFAEGIYQFGRGSGEHFATVQGGVYNGLQTTALIHQIRELGVGAVGQSSWGPCVFAIGRDPLQAEWLQERLQSEWGQHYHLMITTADNRGARMEFTSSLADTVSQLQ